MAENLPNSTSPNWNIPHDEKDKDDFSSTSISNRQPSSMFPHRSFSSIGGGDAPPHLLPNMPRVRNQLFTISTRAVMTSHSQLSVNYSSVGGACGGSDRTLQHFSSSSSSVSVDSDIEEIGIKPLNTNYLGLPPLKETVTSKTSKEDAFFKMQRSNILSRSKRCIHGSFEDLLQATSGGEKGGGVNKNRRRSCPQVPSNPSSKRAQMIEAANDLLVEENKHLIQTIQMLRRKLIMSKISTVFTLEAVKRRGKAIKAVEAQKLDKERQCAARLILHSLLLNSWRNTKRELDIRLGDNADLRKSVENFALQVQVLRHVQTGERQKAQEKANIIRDLNEELTITKDENQTMRKEMEKMENELNSLQASSENLIDENKVLSEEIDKMMDTKNKLMEALDWERLRSEQFSKENASMKENLKNFEAQLKEATEQKTHWQERARCSESETWELQLHLESRASTVQELTASCEALRAEKMKLIDLKSQLKANLDRTTLALEDLTGKNDNLMRTYEMVKTERDSKAAIIQELEKTLGTTKKEFSEIEKELLAYKLQNVRKRREWGNALYFIISPLDALQRKLL